MFVTTVCKQDFRSNQSRKGKNSIDAYDHLLQAEFQVKPVCWKRVSLYHTHLVWFSRSHAWLIRTLHIYIHHDLQTMHTHIHVTASTCSRSCQLRDASQEDLNSNQLFFCFVFQVTQKSERKGCLAFSFLCTTQMDTIKTRAVSLSLSSQAVVFLPKNCLEQWDEWGFQPYEWNIWKNSQAIKHETAQCNTAKLSQPNAKHSSAQCT